jgi:outer membrane protein insertion porin family/translocation and assembly module TamA
LLARRSKGHLVVALGLLACTACGPTPTRPVVSAIDLRETSSPRVVDDSAVLDGLATSDEYDRNVLARDLDRIERYYRARGYYEAKVTAARVLEPDARHTELPPGEQHVRLELRVAPGKPVIVRNVEREGGADLPLSVNIELGKARALLEPGALFDEAKFDDMKGASLDALRDNGYPYAKVDAKAHVDLSAHSADITVTIDPGVRATYGEVTIVGLKDIPESPVRDNLEVAIRKGKRYSRGDLAEARQALLNLGVFSSVDVHDDLTHPNDNQVPIQVVVHEGTLHALRLGGGVEFDVLRLNAHLRMGWEHFNFLGGMRDLQLTATPGIDFYPTRLDGETPLAPTRALLENSLQLKFLQPAFIEGRTTGTIDASYDIKPALYPLPPKGTLGGDPAIQRIVGYQSLTTDAGVKRDFPLRITRRLRGNLNVALAYNWQANFPFMYQESLPAGLADVRVAFPSLNTIFDLVDDRLNPHAGVRFLNRFEIADKIFGGSVSDLKIQPEIRAYIPITPKTVTLATRLTLGFLFPRDYGQSLTGQTPDPTNPAVVFDQEKLLMRAFYSGGANSNRGYPIRGVGPQGPVGFLIPTGQNCTIAPGLSADQQLAAIKKLNPSCIRPTGGFTLWEASLELRFPISGPVNMVAFADASDVTRDVGEIRFDVPHLSVGPGLRYMTPVGALRLDIGYRVPGLQQIGQANLDVEEGGNTVGTLFGIPWLPVALNIALGEAF